MVIINEGRLMASGSLEELTAFVRKKDGIIVKVRRDIQEAAAEIKKVEGVDKVNRDDVELKVEWKQGADLRDAIARLLVEKGFGLLEMRPMAMNIEDLYLKIVSGGVEP